MALPFEWEWDKKAPHILNIPFQTADGSRVDPSSIVLLLTSKQKRMLKPEYAKLIEGSPRLAAACLSAFSAIFDMIELGFDPRTLVQERWSKLLGTLHTALVEAGVVSRPL